MGMLGQLILQRLERDKRFRRLVKQLVRDKLGLIRISFD
jgi:hypothetical protein